MYTSLSWFFGPDQRCNTSSPCVGAPCPAQAINFIYLYLDFDHRVILAIFWNLWILLYQYGILYLWTPFICDIKSLDYRLPSLCFIYGALPALRQVIYLHILQLPTHPLLGCQYDNLTWWPSLQHTHSGVEFTEPMSSATFFPILFRISNKHSLLVKYHIHIWQVSLQLSCSDNCEIWQPDMMTISTTYPSGVEFTEPMSSATFFPILFRISNKHSLLVKYHIHIWQVSLQLSCSDHCEI